MGVIRIAAAVLLAAVSAAAQEAPPVFIAEDRAPVHGAPGGEQIGSLPPGTKPIEASAVEDGWARIVFGEGDAWTPLAALAPLEPRAVAGGRIADGLVCAGTEPFWSLSVEGPSARLRALDGGDRSLRIGGAVRADGRRFPVRAALAEDGGAPWGDLLIEPRLCSDGMSDRTYPWTASLLPAEGGLRTGCCRLPRAR